MKNNEKRNEEILFELWQLSVFDEACCEALEKFVVDSEKRCENNQDIDELYVSKDILTALATARNRNLIGGEEQKLLQKKVVGFFGLSVGSHAAMSWMMESRADTVKIIDPDSISPTNLNRLKVGWEEVGRPKTESLKEKLTEINPYAKIITSSETSYEKVVSLFDDNPNLDLVVDAIDDMKGKITLRKLARDRKIPLVSAADVGDNVVMDIERYDTDSTTKPFLGRVADIDTVDFEALSEIEKKKMIINLVGFEKNSEQLLDSLLALGKTLGTWPQLGATATIAGGVVATTIKKIMLGEKVNSGRYYLSLDDILVSDFNDNDRLQVRSQKIDKIKEKFGVE